MSQRHTKKINKIVILSTNLYCGGTIVLSELCRSLNKMGIKAVIFNTEHFPVTEEQSDSFLSFAYLRYCLLFFLKRKVCILFPNRMKNNRKIYDYYCPSHYNRCKLGFLPLFNKDRTVVLYPEFLYGNPLKGKNVVRWLLYHYRFSNCPSAYSKSDMFLGYRDVFNASAPISAKKIKNVLMASFDGDLYRRYNFGSRNGNCYIVRKGRKRSDLPDTFDGPVVDNLSEEEKVEVFNRCEHCYSYDTQTFYSSIASLCGCVSIVVMEEGKVREDYRPNGDPCYGVAYGDSPEEIRRALETVCLLKDRISSIVKSNDNNAAVFVNEVESFFDVIIRRRVMVNATSSL